MLKKICICVLISLGVYAMEKATVEYMCNDCMKKRLFVDMKCTVCKKSDIVCDDEHCVRYYCKICDRMRVFDDGTCNSCGATEKYTDDTATTLAE